MSHKPATPLKLCFIPYFGSAIHTFPLLDIARFFAFHGQNVTIITTPSNATSRIKKVLNNETNPSDHRIFIHTISLPLRQVGLNDDFNDLEYPQDPNIGLKLFQAIHLLRAPIQEFLTANPTDCIVSDGLFPWYADMAAELNVPSISYNSLGAFASCVLEGLRSPDSPHHQMEFTDQPFIVPGLPIEIKLTKDDLPGHFTAMLEAVRECELKSYGVIFDSFEELDSDFVNHYSKLTGSRVITIGPAAEIHRKITGRIERSFNLEKTEHDECLTWLNSKNPNSVLYINFGNESTDVKFSNEQLIKIASALESSGREFIWVVAEKENEKLEDEQKWLPIGFHDNVKGRGKVIKGWAPHLSILNHSSVGGFMGRCSLVSILEGFSAGVPLVTFSSSFEQFYVEKFLVANGGGLGLGGNKIVSRESINKAIEELMDDKREKTKEMRRKVQEYAKMAKGAVEEGGSSYNNVMNLIQQLQMLRDNKNNTYN